MISYSTISKPTSLTTPRQQFARVNKLVIKSTRTDYLKNVNPSARYSNKSTDMTRSLRLKNVLFTSQKHCLLNPCYQ